MSPEKVAKITSVDLTKLYEVGRGTNPRQSDGMFVPTVDAAIAS